MVYAGKGSVWLDLGPEARLARDEAGRDEAPCNTLEGLELGPEGSGKPSGTQSGSQFRMIITAARAEDAQE